MITCFFVVLQECRVNCIGQVHWSLSEVRQKTAITLSTSRTYQQESQVFHMDVIFLFYIWNVIYPFLGVFLSSVMWNVLFACDVHEDIYTECWYNLYNVEFCYTCWLQFCCKYELNNKCLLKTMCLLYCHLSYMQEKMLKGNFGIFTPGAIFTSFCVQIFMRDKNDLNQSSIELECYNRLYNVIPWGMHPQQK